MLHWLWVAIDLVVAIVAACHVLLNKRDPRAVTGWIALCFLTPFVGSILYFMFGVNRVRTRAQRLASNSPLQPDHLSDPANTPSFSLELPEEVAKLAGITAQVTGRELLAGNHVDCLHNGEQAYPAMIASMNRARHTLFLSTYIFDRGYVGQMFIDALARATRRGVDVRVIIDGVGELTTGFSRASSRLIKLGVKVARFIPPTLIPPALYINLRNHRKILVVDSEVAFTGGMNISHRHMAADSSNPHRVTDVHFRLLGPVIAQIQQAFLEDWGFLTADHTPVAMPQNSSAGAAYCRAIADGPNETLEQLERVLVATICSAKQRVAVMTPYFLPSRDLMAALRATALRGIDVSVFLPGTIDHRIVQWAARNILHLLIRDGGKVYYQPAPFCHSKLLVIDDHYSLIGSANLDPRSLRLNFELAVEVFDKAFSAELWRHFQEIRNVSRLISLDELNQRPLSIRLRDAVAWTCSPYL